MTLKVLIPTYEKNRLKVTIFNQQLLNRNVVSLWTKIFDFGNISGISLLRQSVSESFHTDIQRIPVAVIKAWREYPDVFVSDEKVPLDIHSINFHYMPNPGHWIISWQCPCTKTIYLFDSIFNIRHKIYVEEELHLFYNVQAFKISYEELTTQQGMRK